MTKYTFEFHRTWTQTGGPGPETGTLIEMPH